MKDLIRVFAILTLVVGGMSLMGCGSSSAGAANSSTTEQDNKDNLRALTTSPSDFSTQSTQPISTP